MKDTITLVVADDHPAVLQGLRFLLENQDHIRIVGEARRGEEALSLIRYYQPSIALLDIEMKGGKSGLEVARSLAKEPRIPTKIVIYTGHDQKKAYLHQAEQLKSVVKGFVAKDRANEELIQCLEDVYHGKYFSSPSLSRRPPKEEGHYLLQELTPKEIEVLKMVALQKSTEAITVALGVKKSTVDYHRLNIRHKLGLTNQGKSLMVYAMEHREVILDL